MTTKSDHDLELEALDQWYKDAMSAEFNTFWLQCQLSMNNADPALDKLKYGVSLVRSVYVIMRGALGLLP